MDSEACFVIGGGPSLKGFDFSLLKDQNVVAINQAIWKISTAQYFVTTDYTWLLKNQISGFTNLEAKNKFKKHPAEKYFILALGQDRLIPIDEFHCRDRKFGLTYDLSLFDRVIRPKQYGGMGFSFEDFHYGSDSGFCGLQLAVILGFKTIYLLGFDFCNSGVDTHYHEDYTTIFDVDSYQAKLNEFLIPYPQALKELREKGIQVFSCSHISKLNGHILYVDIGKIL